MKRISLITFLLVLLTGIYIPGLIAQESKVNIPKQEGLVNDFEDVLSKEEEKELSRMLKDYRKRSNKEIVIISLDSIPGDIPFDNYSVMLSQSWQVGKKTNSNAFTVVLSSRLGAVRINTTVKTRKELPNEVCKEVIEGIFIPEFRNKNYYEGLMEGIKVLMEKWQ